MSQFEKAPEAQNSKDRFQDIIRPEVREELKNSVKDGSLKEGELEMALKEELITPEEYDSLATLRDLGVRN